MLSYEPAETGEFKILNTDAADDVAFCPPGSGKVYLGGDIDENELQDPIYQEG